MRGSRWSWPPILKMHCPTGRFTINDSFSVSNMDTSPVTPLALLFQFRRSWMASTRRCSLRAQPKNLGKVCHWNLTHVSSQEIWLLRFDGSRLKKQLHWARSPNTISFYRMMWTLKDMCSGSSSESKPTSKLQLASICLTTLNPTPFITTECEC